MRRIYKKFCPSVFAYVCNFFQIATFAVIIGRSEKNRFYVRIFVQSKLHVICDTLSGSWGFAFFKAGRYTASDLDITAEAPCLILLERNPDSGTYVMRISSPSQNRAEIGVEITMAGLGKERITAEFPVNDQRYAGMTQSYELSK